MHGRSDHQTLILAPKTKQKVPPVSKKYRLMKPANLNALGLKMNLENWVKVHSEYDVDDKVSVFNSIIKPWMTHNIKALIIERQKAFTKGKTSKYESLRAKVTKMISNSKAAYYKSKAKGCHKSNPAK